MLSGSPSAFLGVFGNNFSNRLNSLHLGGGARAALPRAAILHLAWLFPPACQGFRALRSASLRVGFGQGRGTRAAVPNPGRSACPPGRERPGWVWVGFTEGTFPGALALVLRVFRQGELGGDRLLGSPCSPREESAGFPVLQSPRKERERRKERKKCRIETFREMFGVEAQHRVWS